MEIIVHADDFGITLEQSKLILARSSKCGGEGALNSTSALVTSPHFSECAAFAKPFVDAGLIKMGLHLNLVEGPALSSAEDAPLLVGANGMFRQSFARMLLCSSGPKRTSLTQQVRQEARAQIQAFLKAFPQMRSAFRVDSHQHFHLIPAVFDGLMAAIQDEGCTLEYLRIPAEPLAPFLRADAVRKHVSVVNIVKNQLLNALWKRCAPSYPDCLPKSAAFYGLALSGCMQHIADERFLQGIIREAEQEERGIELLFHPGGVPSVDECLAPHLRGFCEFYLSENRQAEADILPKLPLCAITV